MTTITFLAEWALRSSILILSGALLIWAPRVKSPQVRLAAWIALLGGSMALPVFIAKAPRIPVVLNVTEARAIVDAAPRMPFSRAATPVQARFDWAQAGLALYGMVSLGLLLRLGVGLVMGGRLLRASRATGEDLEGIEIRESDRLTAPVTLGLFRATILLPPDWRQWSAEKRMAVLAHERSHIRRFDPAVQFLSAVHRALLWHSPMSWFLHNRIVRVAEEASDDVALTRVSDRTMYAEVLLGFMRLGVRGASRAGVPMARYGRMEARINRILEGSTVSRGLTRWGLAAILAVASPLTYVVAAAHPAETPAPPQVRKASPPAAPADTGSPYLRGMGSVAASQTVVVRARVDGLLHSMNFREGELVQKGQVLASLDSPSFEGESSEAQARVERDIKSPITGVTGFRMVDPGNTVHPGQPLVVVTQIQPAAVLFTVPEDELPRLRRILAHGTGPVVEAWNRNNTMRIASGRLTAIDNQIDEQTGTAKLKALFENEDGALFPGQFVNARLLLSGR